MVTAAGAGVSEDVVATRLGLCVADDGAVLRVFVGHVREQRDAVAMVELDGDGILRIDPTGVFHERVVDYSRGHVATLVDIAAQAEA